MAKINASMKSGAIGFKDIVDIKRKRKRIIKQFQKEATRAIRQKVMESAWKSPEAAESIARDLHSLIRRNKVFFWFTKPWAVYHEYGVKAQPMKWLEGINKTIPITLPNGVTIFRKSPKKVYRYKWANWRHPGIKPKRFFRDGLKKGLKVTRKKMQKHRG